MEDSMEIRDEVAVEMGVQKEEEVDNCSTAYNIMRPYILNNEQKKKFDELLITFTDLTEQILDFCPDSNYREYSIMKLVEAKHWAIYSMAKCDNETDTKIG